MRHCLALVVLIPAFSGCFGGDLDAPPLAVGMVPCGELGPHCTRQDELNGGVLWIMHDAVIDYRAPAEGAPRINAALWVTLQDHHSVILRNLTIYSNADGIVILNACRDCKVLIEDVRLVGRQGGTGINHDTLQVPGDITTTIRRTTVTGFARGMDLFAGGTITNQRTDYAVEVDNVTVACSDTGGVIRASELKVASFHVSGCREHGLALDVFGNGLVQDSTFYDSQNGLWTAVHDDATLRVTRSTMDGNREWGIMASGFGRLTMDQLRVVNNGVPENASALTGGILVWTAGSIHESLISGNRDYGVHPGLQIQYDATQNYWGDPNGPRVLEPPLPPLGFGQGDPVSKQVDFLPYLESPPGPDP